MEWQLSDLKTAASLQANSHRQQGFTLIELLVVFSLLALLLTLAVPRYLQTVDTAREKVRQQNIETLRDALDKFRADQGRYPVDLPELVVKQYLRRIPVDPVSGSDEWLSLPHPLGSESGIHDVLPPGAMPAGKVEQPGLNVPLSGDLNSQVSGSTPARQSLPAAPTNNDSASLSGVGVAN